MAKSTIPGTIVAKSQDAYVAHQKSRRIWEIGTKQVGYRLQFQARKGLRLLHWENKSSGNSWIASDASGEFAIQLGAEMISSTAANLRYVGYETRTHANGALELRVSLARGALRIHRHYVAFPETSVVEQWLAVENAGDSPLRDLTALNSSLALPGNLWLFRIQGLDAPAGGDPPTSAVLYLSAHPLSDGTVFDLYSRGRSSEENLGWYALHAYDRNEGIVAGIEWSGAWWTRFNCQGGSTQLENVLNDIRRDLAPGESFETPRRFFAFYHGNLEDAANVTHDFARRYLMTRPADFPWAHYNSWFAHYTNIDEAQLRQAVDIAAELGLEAFCIDAGWYAGSPREADFSFGLGTWRENREKFPSGLAAFADYVHGKGLKFGLWVEPERVDLKYAGPGTDIPFEWLSPRTPFDAPPPEGLPQNARVCFGHPGAREWAKQWLARIVQDYHVDWLKWDNNLWLSCDPPGEVRDREYAHVHGLYEILDYLRAQFPHLVIENCASGGHRMDFGLLRRTDVQWMVDDTEPSFRVRHYFAGASYPFPPEYLNAWLVESYWEHIANASPAQLRAWLRSRMMGAFGLSVPLAWLSAEQRGVVAEEIVRYKNLRPLLAGQMYHLLPQTKLLAPQNLQPAGEPDAVEFFQPGEERGVVFFFQGAAPRDNCHVSLQGLAPERVYRLQSDDRSIEQEGTGQQWMEQGVEIANDPSSPSLIITIASL
ncbi:MAG: alpha-galactosidase [Chloroflexi bacterium]|nr:alpha-galactosidase [Chloroflexota bacterium]